MNDDPMNLEHVLRERAAEVPFLQEAPPNMLVRARWRIVRNALTSVVATGVIVVAVSAGLGSLRTPSNQVPGTSTPPPSTSSCRAAALRATATLEGAAGSVEGSIDLTNLSTEPCILEGQPTVTLFSSVGQELSVPVKSVIPQWQADGASPPDGWPVVRLRPGSVAAIRVRWTNPCPQLEDPALWRIDLPGGKGTLDVSGADAVPPCNGTAEPSTLEVGPFEPSSGGETK
jgi:hypothetical protein